MELPDVTDVGSLGEPMPPIARLLLLALVACTAPESARIRYAMAVDDDDRVAAAQVLAHDDDPRLARWVEWQPAALAETPEGPWLLAAAARRHREGARWMWAQWARGASLDDRFPELHSAPDEGLSVVVADEPAALARALVEVLGADAFACRWAAHLAAAERGRATEALRTAIARPGIERTCVMNGLASNDAPDPVPAPLLEVFGAPQDPHESALLRRWYARALEVSVEGLEAIDVEGSAALVEAWTRAFPDEPAPLDRADRAALAYLREREAGAIERPSFADVVSFLAQHHRFNWLTVLAPYIDAGEWPSNGLSQVCRASAPECADLLRAAPPGLSPAAADVAPVLDLEGGDAVLMTACDLLPYAEAIALAHKALGAGLSDVVRETAQTCLEIKEEGPPALVAAPQEEPLGNAPWAFAFNLD